MISRTTHETYRPLVAIGVDASVSVPLNADSEYYKTRFGRELEILKERLSENFDVKMYSFGDHVREGIPDRFSDAETDPGTFLEDMRDLFGNRNLVAVVLACDGLWNRGEDPIRVAERVPCAVHTVALGDTIIQRDVSIRNVLYNKVAFLGDRVPVEMEISMHMLPGVSTWITLEKEGKTIFRNSVASKGKRDIIRIPLLMDADRPGMQHYTAKAAPVPGEVTTLNNRYDFFIEVMDARQKIVLLYQSPHPDIAALQAAFMASNRFVFESFPVASPPSGMDGYSLVILHQIPNGASAGIVRSVAESGKPLLVIAGASSDLGVFNAMKLGLTINSDKSGFVESVPAFNPKFSLFAVSDENRKILAGYPPLMAPFGAYQYGQYADVLFFQKIGAVQSGIPLVLFFQLPEKRTCIITGENIWRWRMTEMAATGEPKIFDGIISYIAQYLTAADDKSYFRVKVAPGINELHDLILEAELYNKVYEQVNEPDVEIVITDQSGNVFPFVFGRTSTAYLLNAGIWPPGIYTYKASVRYGTDLYERKGSFLISPMEKEKINLTADHGIMRKIASENQGITVYPENLLSLADTLDKRKYAESFSATSRTYTDLIGTAWFFLLITGLLTLEWVVRKRGGEI